MKLPHVLILALLLCASLSAQVPDAPRHPATAIIVDQAGPEIFPESWRTARINASAEPLAAEARGRSIELVQHALAKYPAAVLTAHLKAVYVLGGLKYSGVSAGGTNSRSAVYLVNNAKSSPENFERIFHAEFSSILLRNFPGHLDRAAWQKINPPGFVYRGSGVQSIRSKQAGLQLSDALHAEGFLNEYGQSSVEEDFNGYASRLLLSDADLWAAIRRFPGVKAKADLVIAFYGKLDAVFTPEWFRALGP